jgi:hypothetical protein
LSLSEDTIKNIKALQVFGIQMDETWSFVGRKQRKRWIWIVYDPIHRLVVTSSIFDPKGVPPEKGTPGKATKTI